jgi:class 3 adenylate cyclase
MGNDAIQPVLSHFKDKELERTFIEEYDNENRIFFRTAIYLSCFAWTIWYSGIYFSHRNVFVPALILLLLVLGLPFIIVVVLSFYKKYSTLTHNLIAFCNFAAGCICIYVAVYLIKDITFLCAGIICISFFCYFIIRVRFKPSFVITLSYAAIAQVCVITSGHFSNYQIFTSSSGIWLGFFIATMAGYFFERTNRSIFIQNKVIKEQKEALVNEQHKSEKLLLNILPKEIADKLKDKEGIIAESFESVSVLFADIVNFTTMSSALTAEEVVDLLNEIFSLFDVLVEKHGCEKIKTIGDAYMAVSGVPVRDENHAQKSVALAMDMLKELRHFNEVKGIKTSIRIGINSGPVVAGVIGRKKFLYHLWGDTVNTASRMESYGVPDRIQITNSTRLFIHQNYIVEPRGAIDVKGKGKMNTFFILQAANNQQSLQ